MVRSGPKTHLEIQVPEDLTEWVQSPGGLAELEDIRAKTCACGAVCTLVHRALGAF